jgi:hypothetical protein
MATAERTQDHDRIRQWVQARGGVPTFVKGTGGMLRIDFVEGAASHGHEENLEEVSWDDWFKVFDERELSFLYSSERDSRFFKLVSGTEEHAETRSGSKRSLSKSSAGGRKHS